MGKLFPGDAFGDSGGNRQLEELMLKGLDHEQNPENKAEQAHQQVDANPQKTETEEAATYKELAEKGMVPRAIANLSVPVFSFICFSLRCHA